jgi:hypothetical protein
LAEVGASVMRRTLDPPYAVGVGALPHPPGRFPGRGTGRERLAEPASVDRGRSRRSAFRAVPTRVYQVDTSSLLPTPTSPNLALGQSVKGPAPPGGPGGAWGRVRTTTTYARLPVDTPIHIRAGACPPPPVSQRRTLPLQASPPKADARASIEASRGYLTGVLGPPLPSLRLAPAEDSCPTGDLHSSVDAWPEPGA